MPRTRHSGRIRGRKTARKRFVKSYFHPPVSKINMNDLIDYVYWMAKDLDWTWSKLDGAAPKQRQPRRAAVTALPQSLCAPRPVAAVVTL